MSLKAELIEIRQKFEDAGGTPSIIVPKKLEDYRVKLRRRSLFAFASTLALIVVIVPIAILNPPEQADILAKGGTVFVVLSALVTFATYSEKHWRNTELLLILIEEASDRQISAVIDKLIAKL